MKILLSVASARLAYGGPALSVTALARNLARSGAQTGIWCPDGSATEIELTGSSGELHRLSGSFEEAVSRFGMPDVVHDNGIWWPHNHAIAILSRRHGIARLVSPRGMLEPWARRHKPVRKAIAWQLYQRRDLLAAAALHATSPQELETLAQVLPGQQARLIGNGLDLPEAANTAFSSVAPRPGIRQALFLGRLHPVKGLPMLLRAWQLAAAAGWRLVLAGPDEGGHRAELEQLIATLGIAGTVEFAGAVSGKAKEQLFSNSQLFVLASHSESFGMSIGEALAYGLPVLTTQNVPWPQIADVGCGWRVPGEVEPLAAALREALACPDEALAAMGRRGRRLVAEEFGWESLTEHFIALYAGLLSQGPKPDFP